MDKLLDRQFIMLEVADLLERNSSEPINIRDEIEFADKLVCNALGIDKEKNPLDFISPS